MAIVEITLGSRLLKLTKMFEEKQFCDVRILCDQSSPEILVSLTSIRLLVFILELHKPSPWLEELMNGC